MGAPSLIGLTGGIAAGKSEALRAFERLGAETISTDEVTRELLGGEEVRALLVDRWGHDLAPGGEVDRAKVAEVVFADPEKLSWLEAVLHPRVAARIAQWREGLPAGTALAVVEVPLLFETGLEAAFDATVSIVAPEAVRERRAAERGQAGLEGRSSRQLSQDEKASRATHVVVNDGDLADLEATIAELMGQMGAAATP